MRRLVVVLVLAWPLPTMADLSAGVEASNRGDYQTAYKEFLPEAEAGNTHAQFNLGVMYENGRGVLEDDREAVMWYRRAAEQGLAEGQLNLGRMYANGEGVPQDAREAVMWYRRAAEQGLANAQHNLGFMYANGEGVPKDDREAVKWYRRAAEQGLANAQLNLGVMYANGEGVPKDDREAVKWYRRAAEQGLATAQFNLGLMYTSGESFPQDDREAVMWYRRAAEQGLAIAQYNLGVNYHYGKGVPQDDREAVKWYRRAAEQELAEGQYNLGFMYHYGKGVPQDDREAVKWYRRAAEQGNAGAQSNLGVMYENGRGVLEDDREAVMWYRRAAEQGLATAQFNLGLMYAVGKGIPQNSVQAYAWCNLASAQGNEVPAEIIKLLSQIMTQNQIAEAQRVSATLAQHIKRGQPVSAATILSRPYTRAGPSPAQVMEAQQLLARLGYQPGAVDGILGRKTAAATRAFQSNMDITPTGNVSEELLALLKIAVAAMASEPGREEQPDEPSQLSSGSGFFVSDAGHVVTNHHVVESCGSVTVTAAGTQQAATVAAVDQPNDLALLKAPAAQAQPATFRQPQRAVLGESVTVAGFPLSGLLTSDLNITAGTVSALAGPGNNPRFLQITAPVQLGNSGGPLLDKSGQVIGVVVGKLNAAKVFSATGDLPQNINFAIKGALVRGFLDIHGVNYVAGAEAAPLGGEAVAAKARRFVVPVACWD